MTAERDLLREIFMLDQKEHSREWIMATAKRAGHVVKQHRNAVPQRWDCTCGMYGLQVPKNGPALKAAADDHLRNAALTA